MSNQVREEVRIGMPDSLIRLDHPIPLKSGIASSSMEYTLENSAIPEKAQIGPSSENDTVISEISASGLAAGVQEQSEHKNFTLPKDASPSIRGDSRASAWWNWDTVSSLLEKHDVVLRPFGSFKQSGMTSGMMYNQKYVIHKRRRSKNEIPSSGLTVGVQEQSEDKNFNLLKDAYRSIKGDSRVPAAWGEIIDNCIELKTPLGNTVLHIAATYDRSGEWLSMIAQKAPQLLTARNSNDDMALHAAARTGRIFSVNKLLAAHLRNAIKSSDPEKALKESLAKNKRGNTFIHEALLSGQSDMKVDYFWSSNEIESSVEDAPLDVYKLMALLAALFQTNKQNKSILYLAIEADCKNLVKLFTKLSIPELAQDLIKIFPGLGEVLEVQPSTDPVVPPGKSPLLAAILKKNKGMLNLILEEQPAWIKLRDTEGRIPLHYAASIGYLDGVQYLLSKCASCAVERDNCGRFPLHLASDGGHVEVIKELLKIEYPLEPPRELLDNDGRNFLHLAVVSGKFSVVSYILKVADNELKEMINDKDNKGNTPLHLATLHCHTKIVYALTWDKSVKLESVNEDNETALDICVQWPPEKTSLRQWLIFDALKSASVPHANPLQCSIKVPSQSTVSFEAPKMDQYKDRINTLILVSTIIITATFAAGFTLPGGVKSSDPAEGMALMLHRMLFKLFIFCITISMYGAISVAIVLIWAQLGDLTLAVLALDVAKYLLGVTLGTLSIAFLSGLHLVISDLSWLATATLVMSMTFILMLLLLYTLLWLPSTSNCLIVRWISYYPFLMLASLVEAREKVLVVRNPTISSTSNGSDHEKARKPTRKKWWRALAKGRGAKLKMMGITKIRCKNYSTDTSSSGSL